MTNWITYEGVAFNADWVKSKTFSQFAKHEGHHGFSQEQLREVYGLCGGKVEKAEDKKADKDKDQ